MNAARAFLNLHVIMGAEKPKQGDALQARLDDTYHLDD